MANARLTNAKPHQIRIIGGAWRGRRIDVASVPGLRPTPDRLRETLFNWLMFDVAGSHCLELCAGTGALSFEALSRGAQSAVLVETNAHCFQALQRWINHHHCQSQATVLSQDVFNSNLMSRLRQHQQTKGVTKGFDLIFFDPPFDWPVSDNLACLKRCIDHQLTHPQTLIYLEQGQPIQTSQLADQWQVIKYRQVASVHGYLLTAL